MIALSIFALGQVDELSMFNPATTATMPITVTGLLLPCVVTEAGPETALYSEEGAGTSTYAEEESLCGD